MFSGPGVAAIIGPSQHDLGVIALPVVDANTALAVQLQSMVRCALQVVGA